MTKQSNNPNGRPSSYTPAKGLEICERIALGESLRHITSTTEHLPHLSTVQRWLASGEDALAQFREQYVQARQAQADYYGDQVLEVAQMAVEEAQAPQDNKTANALVQARRLQMDALKWTAGQLAPKKWGTSHKSSDTTTRKVDHEATLNKARDRVAGKKAEVMAIDGGKAGRGSPPKQ